MEAADIGHCGWLTRRNLRLFFSFYYIREETRFNVISGRGHRALYLDFTRFPLLAAIYRIAEHLGRIVNYSKLFFEGSVALSVLSFLFNPFSCSCFHGKIFTSPVKRNSTTGPVR